MMNIHLALDRLNDDELLHYLHEEIQMKGRHKEVMVRNENDQTRPSVLQNALELQKSTQVTMKLIEIGGRELLMEKCNGKNALHMLSWWKLQLKLSLRSLRLGGVS